MSESKFTTFGQMGQVVERVGSEMSELEEQMQTMDAENDENLESHAGDSSHIPSGGTTGQVLRMGSDGNPAWGADKNTTYAVMTAATASAAGKAGLVPAPAAGKQNSFLRGDGTWATPYTHPTTAGNKHIPAGGSTGQILKWSSAGTASWGDPADTTYTHPTTSGNKHIPSGGSSGQILRWSSDGTAAWGAENNTTYAVMTAATASAAGKAGLVPAPAAGKQAAFLRGDGTWATPTNTVYTHPTTSGNKHIPSGGSSGQILRWSSDGTAVWGAENNTTYAVMTAATSSAAGAAGLVPAPAAGKQAAFLRGDGTWATPYTHPTTAGNKHIPAGGSAGQFLCWSAAGTAAWTTVESAEDLSV